MAKRINTNVIPYRAQSQTQKNVAKTVRKQISQATQTEKNRALIERALDEPDVTTRVKSSNLKSISYEKELKDLTITFKRGGRTYVYYNVPYGIYVGLVNAPSKGQYFWRFIGNRYAYAEVTKSQVKGRNPRSKTRSDKGTSPQSSK